MKRLSLCVFIFLAFSVHAAPTQPTQSSARFPAIQEIRIFIENQKKPQLVFAQPAHFEEIARKAEALESACTSYLSDAQNEAEYRWNIYAFYECLLRKTETLTDTFCNTQPNNLIPYCSERLTSSIHQITQQAFKFYWYLFNTHQNGAFTSKASHYSCLPIVLHEYIWPPLLTEINRKKTKTFETIITPDASELADEKILKQMIAIKTVCSQKHLSEISLENPTQLKTGLENYNKCLLDKVIQTAHTFCTAHTTAEQKRKCRQEMIPAIRKMHESFTKFYQISRLPYQENEYDKILYLTDSVSYLFGNILEMLLLQSAHDQVILD